MLKFPDGKKLTVNGTLIATGTSGSPVTFQKSGSGRWYGIEVNSGTLDLDYTTVKESWYGVTVYNAYTLNIWYSTITDNYYRNLRFDNISGGTVGYTTISNASYDGIQCVQYASPTLKPYNNIKGHMNGVQGDNTSLPYLGQSPDQGLNDIANNWDFDIYSDNSNTLYAHYNWWGSSSPSPSVSDDVSWQPYLTYDPTAGRAAIAQESGSSSPRQTTAQDTTGRAAFRQAYAAYLAGDFDAALAAFETVTDTYPDSPAGKQALAFSLRSLQQLGRSADVTTFLQTKRNTFAGKEIAGLAQSLLVGLYIRNGDYAGAKTAAAEILQNHAGSDLEKYALYDLGLIHWYHLDDPKAGEAYFRQLITTYPEDALAMSARATLGEWQPPPAEELAEENTRKPAADANDTVPATFTLFANHPNPFNPTTVIRYGLPESGEVTLRVFDSLGREVRVWYLGVQAAGLYSVRWDGRDTTGEPVASGVYFYRLAFHPLAADNAPRLLQGKMSLLR